MSDKLLSLGIPPEFIAHAKHFAGVFRHLGWTPAQIDAALAWGAGFKGNPADLPGAFDQFCAQQGIERTEASLAVSWRDQVAERGIDSMPAEPRAPMAADPARRLREIEAEMQKPRDDSEYWRNAEMRDEYRALLEGVGGVTRPGNASQPGGAADSRKAEIEKIMRANRSRYWQDETMQREYSEILQHAEQSGAAGVDANPSTWEGIDNGGNQDQ